MPSPTDNSAARVLEGAWVPVNASVAGTPLAVADLRVRYLLLEGGGYRIIDGSNQVVDGGEYRVDAATAPPSNRERPPTREPGRPPRRAGLTGCACWLTGCV